MALVLQFSQTGIFSVEFLGIVSYYRKFIHVVQMEYLNPYQSPWKARPFKEEYHNQGQSNQNNF